jgi:hypothetical protein
METNANASKHDGNAQDVSTQSVATEPTPHASGDQGMKPLKKPKGTMVQEWVAQPQGREEE